MPSTEPESPEPERFPQLEEQTSEKDDALAALESKLQEESDKRREERFLWILVTVALLDILLLADAPNPTLPIVVLVIELIALLLIARRLGMENLAVLLDRLLNNVGPKS